MPAAPGGSATALCDGRGRDEHGPIYALSGRYSGTSRGALPGWCDRICFHGLAPYGRAAKRRRTGLFRIEEPVCMEQDQRLSSRAPVTQTLKNRILLENYYLPGDLEAQIEAFVADYNRLRYHESIGNLTPADVYFGRGQTILIERERIKRQTIANRRLLHRRQAA
jgi:hypothetical protein